MGHHMLFKDQSIKDNDKKKKKKKVICMRNQALLDIDHIVPIIREI